MAVLQLQKLSPLAASLDSGTTSRHGILQKVGEWIMEGASELVGLYREEKSEYVIAQSDSIHVRPMTRVASSTSFFYLTPGPTTNLVTHGLQVVPAAFVIAAPISLQPSPDALSSSGASALPSPSLPNLALSIPNPFKPNFFNRSLDTKPEKTIAAIPGRVLLGPAVSMGQAPITTGAGRVKGIQVWRNSEVTRGFLWGENDLLVRSTQSMSVRLDV